MARDDLPEYLTIGEVSKMLKIHPNTLRNRGKSGALKPIRIGERKLRRYEKEDVLKFLEQK